MATAWLDRIRDLSIGRVGINYMDAGSQGWKRAAEIGRRTCSLQPRTLPRVDLVIHALHGGSVGTKSTVGCESKRGPRISGLVARQRRDSNSKRNGLHLLFGNDGEIAAVTIGHANLVVDGVYGEAVCPEPCRTHNGSRIGCAINHRYVVSDVRQVDLVGYGFGGNKSRLISCLDCNRGV